MRGSTVRQEDRNRRIFELWLAGWQNTEIASELGCAEATVREVIAEMATLPNLRLPDQSSATHATDFQPPIYNVWKQQTKTNGSTGRAGLGGGVGGERLPLLVGSPCVAHFAKRQFVV